METISHLPWKLSPPVQLSDPKAARETLRSRSHEPLQLILSCLIQLEACGSKHHLQIWLLHPSRAPWQKLVWISRCSTFWEKKTPTKPKPNPKQTKKDLSRTHLIYHLPVWPGTQGTWAQNSQAMSHWEWHSPPILHGEVLQEESTETEKGEICCRETQEYPPHLTSAPEEERRRGNLLILAVEVLDKQPLESLAVTPNIQNPGGFRAEPAFPTEERHAILCHTKA